MWHKKTGSTDRTYYTVTHFIAEDLVQWSTSWHQTVHSGQPQAQEAVVDALHQHNLAHDENWVPDVATEVTGHFATRTGAKDDNSWPKMLPANPSSGTPVCDFKIWNDKNYIVKSISTFHSRVLCQWFNQTLKWDSYCRTAANSQSQLHCCAVLNCYLPILTDKRRRSHNSGNGWVWK